MNQGTLSMLVLLVSSPLLACCTTKIMRSEFRETEFHMDEEFPDDGGAKHGGMHQFPVGSTGAENDDDSGVTSGGAKHGGEHQFPVGSTGAENDDNSGVTSGAKHGGMQPFPAGSTGPENGDNSGVKPGKMTSEKVCDPTDPESICGGSASRAVDLCQRDLKDFDSSNPWACTGEGCENTNRAYAAALKAAGRTVSALIPQSNSELQDREPETCTFVHDEESLAQSDCFNPKTATPEGWCCDCLAKVQEVCGGVDNKCFHEFMCDHPKVHKDWKRVECDADQVNTGCVQATSQSTTIDQALPGGHGRQDSLMERQHSAAGAEKVQESGLDEALQDKCSTCSR